MQIEKVKEITDESLFAVRRLVPEIGVHKPLPTRDELIDLIESGSSTLWVARYPDANGEIAGMLTISIYRVPTGVRSIVEDVAVDSRYRRMGIAKALMEARPADPRRVPQGLGTGAVIQKGPSETSEHRRGRA